MIDIDRGTVMDTEPLTLSTYHPKGQKECGCRSCGFIFRNLRAFDAHLCRTIGKPLKCLKPQDTEALTMDSRGIWYLELTKQEKAKLEKLKSTRKGQ